MGLRVMPSFIMEGGIIISVYCWTFLLTKRVSEEPSDIVSLKALWWKIDFWYLE